MKKQPTGRSLIFLKDRESNYPDFLFDISIRNADVSRSSSRGARSFWGRGEGAPLGEGLTVRPGAESSRGAGENAEGEGESGQGWGDGYLSAEGWKSED